MFVYSRFRNRPRQHTHVRSTAHRLHARTWPAREHPPSGSVAAVDGPHHTGHKKAVESVALGRETEPPTVGIPPHHPPSRRVLADRNLGLPQFRSDVHSFIPQLSDGALSLCLHNDGKSFNLHHTPHKHTRRFIQASNEPLVIVTLGRQDPPASLKPAAGSMPLRGPGRSGSEAPPASQAGTPWPAKPLQLRHPPTMRQSAGVVGLQAAAALCASVHKHGLVHGHLATRTRRRLVNPQALWRTRTATQIWLAAAVHTSSVP